MMVFSWPDWSFLIHCSFLDASKDRDASTKLAMNFQHKIRFRKVCLYKSGKYRRNIKRVNCRLQLSPLNINIIYFRSRFISSQLHMHSVMQNSHFLSFLLLFTMDTSSVVLSKGFSLGRTYLVLFHFGQSPLLFLWILDQWIWKPSRNTKNLNPWKIPTKLPHKCHCYSDVISKFLRLWLNWLINLRSCCNAWQLS